MSPEEQEAESFKYGESVAIVLKLGSGQWAIFNCQRKLILITPSMEQVALCISTVTATVERRASSPKPPLLTKAELDSLLDEI